MNRNATLFTLLMVLVGLFVFSEARTSAVGDPSQPQPSDARQEWIDSIMAEMTLEEKIGQMIMPYVYTTSRYNNVGKILEYIEQYHIGGVMLGKGELHKFADAINRYQAASKVPLFISIDGEWGPAMRVDSLMSQPWNMTLGAVNDMELLYRVGESMGRQCLRMGINVNFAPVADVNVNSANPIVGNRSFGSDPKAVADRAIALASGMQSTGVLANAKHFPGHGDTEKDSHKDLPVIPHPRSRIDSVELYPFQRMFDAGVGSVMVGHLDVKSLDPKGGPASLSKVIVTDLLREKMGFKGISFTDALEMKGVTNYYKTDEAAVMAILAGHDIVLEERNVAAIFEAVKQGVASGKITQERIDQSVHRILDMKYRMGLHNTRPVDRSNLLAEINTQRDSALYLEVMEKAMTLLRNENGNLPVKDLTQPIYWVHMGPGEHQAFGDYLRRYAPVMEIDADQWTVKNVQDFNPENARLIVSYHHRYGNPILLKAEISEEHRNKLTALADNGKHTLVMFNMPYGLLDWDSYEGYDGLLVAYQNNPVNQLAAAEVVFGAVAPEGTLPVTVSEKYVSGYGLGFEKINRLTYGYPSQVGMSPEKMSELDALVREVVESRAAPAVHVLVARKGKVVYNKAYGTTMYDLPGSLPVSDNMIYDVASVTKIMATLPLVMRLVDQGKLSLDHELGQLVPSYRGTNKEQLVVRDILTHTAGLQDWIRYYLQTMDADGNLKEGYYSATRKDGYTVEVTQNLFASDRTRDEFRQLLAGSPVSQEKKYVYSDLGFMLLQDIVEHLYGQPLQELAARYLYEPMGAYRTGYLPLERFDVTEIVPSENDTYWRQGVVQGYVHDMTAPFRDGVSGHAGLFSTANDLAKMGQMYLNKGIYGDRRYFSAATVEQFAARQGTADGFFRGLGFDRPRPSNNAMSQEAFGHTGFTGTCVWVDPAYNTVYVFLSNRTFLSMNDNTLSEQNFRTRIQQLVVDAIRE